MRRILEAKSLKKVSLPLAVFMAALCLYVPFLGQRDLWAPDEPRYARVASEMIERHDWVIPHWNGKAYLEKPPLFFWTEGLSALTFGGMGEFSARFPTALSAALLAVIVFLLTLEFHQPPRVGIFAVICFLSIQKLFWQARFAQIEMLLNMLMFGALLCFLRALRTKNLRWWALGGVLCGLGTLAKGPIGLVFPGIFTLIAWSILGPRVFPGFRSGLAVLLGYLAPLVPWVVLALIKGGPDYLKAVFLHQSFGRYLDPWHHYRPFYYYLLVFIPGFLPASLLLIPCFFKRVRDALKERKEGLWASLGIALFVVVFFSLSRGKRDIYILPAYIALCPFMGILMEVLIQKEGEHRRFFKALFLFQGLISLLLGLSGVVILTDSLLGKIPKNPYGPFEGLILLFGSALFALASRLKAASVLNFLMPYIAFSFLLHSFLLPPIDRYKSAKPFVGLLKARLGESLELASFGPPNVGLLFYYGRNIPVFKDAQGVRAIQNQAESWPYVVCYASDIHKLPLKERFKPLLKGKIGSKSLIVGTYELTNSQENLVHADSGH